MKFPKRNIETIVHNICTKNNIKYESLSEGFVLKLSQKKEIKYIYGYNFACNDVSVSKLCDDKSATSELLAKQKIPCFEHHFFMRGFYKKTDIIKLFNLLNKNVVVKPNTGSSGVNVFHCTSLRKLFDCIKIILKENVNFAIAPFYDYEYEYRIIVYKNSPVVMYKKIRNHDWKHNLSVGTNISEDISDTVKKELIKFIKKVTDVLPINFFSIDIAKIDSKYKIVEINSGVMMEKYSQFNIKKTMEVYEKVIIDLFK
jgi:glutathione synthase/RimK-type ligase-like ATP-grasp enzyme